MEQIIKIECKCGVKTTISIIDESIKLDDFMDRVGWHQIDGKWICPLCSRSGLMYYSMKKGEHLKA